MFNVGIIASRRPAPALNLSNRQLEPYGYDAGGYTEYEFSVELWSDGRLRHSRSNGYTLLTTEWRANGAQAGFGNGYEARRVLQAGSAPAGPTGWVSLSSNRMWYWLRDLSGYNATGRILIEIRDTATQTVQASAQFWGPGFAP